MEDITITFNTVLQLFGAVAVVGGGVKIIVNMFNPFRELKAQVEKMRTHLDNDNDRLKKGDERMKVIDKKIARQDEALAMIGLTLSQMIEHQINGNDTGALKAMQKELDEFFYKKKETK